MDANDWMDEIQKALDCKLAVLGTQLAARPNAVRQQVARSDANAQDLALIRAIAAKTTTGHFHGTPEDARRLAHRVVARAIRVEQTRPKRLREILGEPTMRPAVEATLSRALRYLERQGATRAEHAVKAANVARAAGVSRPAWRKTYQPWLVAAGLVRIERGALGGLWLPRHVAHSPA